MHFPRPWLPLVGLTAALLATETPAYAAQVCYQLPFSNPDLADGWGSTAGRSNPHRGVDFPQPGGTPIPAVADGVVRVTTFNGCLGNVIVLEHADGMFSGYAHLIAPSPLSVGAVVAKGETIGRVGTTGTCTTGNHLHLTMSPSVNGYYTGTTVDPYTYIQEHKVCDCDRSGGGLTFSCNGPNEGLRCVKVDEPQDPDSWSDNHLCSDSDLGLAWSSRGPIAGKRCANVTEAAETYASAWSDNHVCVDDDAPVDLAWSSAGPLEGQSCVHWNEPDDPDTWDDNYLCVRPRTTFSAGGFSFSASGPLEGKTCVSVDDRADTNTWNDNYFCSDVDVGLRWSEQGSIDGMTCTNIHEESEHVAWAWADNFLCLPNGSPYTFAWSSSGRIPGQDCVRWYESSDLEGSWADNYLCVTKSAAPGDGSGSQSEPASPGADGSPSTDATTRSNGLEDGEGSCSLRRRSPGPSRFAGLGGLCVIGALLLRRRARSLKDGRGLPTLRR